MTHGVPRLEMQQSRPAALHHVLTARSALFSVHARNCLATATVQQVAVVHVSSGARQMVCVYLTLVSLAATWAAPLKGKQIARTRQKGVAAMADNATQVLLGNSRGAATQQICGVVSTQPLDSFATAVVLFQAAQAEAPALCMTELSENSGASTVRTSAGLFQAGAPAGPFKR